jgi:hypothetical protein
MIAVGELETLSQAVAKYGAAVDDYDAGLSGRLRETFFVVISAGIRHAGKIFLDFCIAAAVGGRVIVTRVRRNSIYSRAHFIRRSQIVCRVNAR